MRIEFDSRIVDPDYWAFEFDGAGEVVIRVALPPLTGWEGEMVLSMEVNESEIEHEEPNLDMEEEFDEDDDEFDDLDWEEEEEEEDDDWQDDELADDDED